MGDFIGKNEFDFEVLENLPPGYLNQIKDMLVNSDIKIRRTGKLDLDVQVYKKNGTTNKDIIFGVQGGENQVQYLFYNSFIFMFNYIPMSKPQQIVFIKNMFINYVANRITKKCLEMGFNFDITKYHIEPRKITNPRY